MKIAYICVLILGFGGSLLSSCAQKNNVEKTNLELAHFTSSDKKLEETYKWAQQMALSYAHDRNDSVGAWYEAALPQREAFCMRDVSHQTVGAQIL